MRERERVDKGVSEYILYSTKLLQNFYSDMYTPLEVRARLFFCINLAAAISQYNKFVTIIVKSDEIGLM